LLATATTSDLVGLRRHAERVRATCGDEATRRRRAHTERSFSTWHRGGVWHAHAQGPIVEGAEIELALRPYRDAALKSSGANEPFGASGFDGLLAMARAASGGTGEKPKERRWQAVIRVDATAIRRGHTIPGEICEIPGVGPIDVSRAIQLLGHATVRVLVKDGTDVLSIARIDRYRTPNLEAALLEKAGFECAITGCSNTGWIDIDHDTDFSKTHDTSYRNLNCLCTRCHHHKTRLGWHITHHPDGTLTLTPPNDPDPP